MTRPRWSPAGVPGRARSEVGSLLVAAVVIALAVLLLALEPRLADRAAGDAVRDAVERAGADAAVTVSVPFTTDTNDGALSVVDSDRVPETAVTVAGALPPAVARLLGRPVSAVASPPLSVRGTSAQVGAATLQLADLGQDGPPDVTWVSGGPADGPSLDENGSIPFDAADEPIQVGLSEAVAAALAADAGTELTLRDTDGSKVRVLVSGVFRADRPDDAIWARVPTLLQAQHVGGAGEPVTMAGGMLSPASLLTARASLARADLARTYTFPAVPAALDGVDPVVAARDVAKLQASPEVLGLTGLYVTVTTDLDTVLRDAHALVRAARAQGSVLVVGLVVAAALALVQVAGLLARRRSSTLRTSRARGASLPGLAAELGLEAVLLAVVSSGVALVVAGEVLAGPVPWAGVAAVVAVAVLAPVVSGVVVAAGGDARARPANRLHRRRAETLGRVRRAGLETAIVLVGVVAVVTIRRRGTGAGDWLVAMAPAAAAVAGAVLAWQLVGPLSRGAVRAARRTRTVVPVLAAARAATGAAATSGFVGLAVAAALLTVAGAVTATVSAGQVDASWQAVGGDVRVTTLQPDQSLGEEVVGVDVAVPARVEPVLPAQAGNQNVRVQVVVVDPGQLAALLAATPLDDAPAAWSVPTADGLPRALVSGGLPAAGLAITWDQVAVPVEVVGTGPALGSGGLPTVIVASQDFSRAVGAPIAPDTLFLVGSGAAEAAVGAAPDGATVLPRAAWLDELRGAPTTLAVTTLARASSVVLLVLLALTAQMSAATGAAGRSATLARMRTLGLTGRDARRVSVGELVPYAVLATTCGILVGWLVTSLTGGSLGLAALTGGSAPDVVVPWWVIGAPVVALVTTIVVILVESGARRRERLGQVLRVGSR